VSKIDEKEMKEKKHSSNPPQSPLCLLKYITAPTLCAKLCNFSQFTKGGSNEGNTPSLYKGRRARP